MGPEAAYSLDERLVAMAPGAEMTLVSKGLPCCGRAWAAHGSLLAGFLQALAPKSGGQWARYEASHHLILCPLPYKLDSCVHEEKDSSLSCPHTHIHTHTHTQPRHRSRPLFQNQNSGGSRTELESLDGKGEEAGGWPVGRASAGSGWLGVLLTSLAACAIAGQRCDAMLQAEGQPKRPRVGIQPFLVGAVRIPSRVRPRGCIGFHG
jgi:hypothetical protein